MIEDESTMAWMLDPEDLQGIEPVRIYEFNTEADRERYLENRFRRRKEQ